MQIPAVIDRNEVVAGPYRAIVFDNMKDVGSFFGFPALEISVRGKRQHIGKTAFPAPEAFNGYFAVHFFAILMQIWPGCNDFFTENEKAGTDTLRGHTTWTVSPFSCFASLFRILSNNASPLSRGAVSDLSGQNLTHAKQWMHRSRNRSLSSNRMLPVGQAETQSPHLVHSPSSQLIAGSMLLAPDMAPWTGPVILLINDLSIKSLGW